MVGTAGGPFGEENKAPGTGLPEMTKETEEGCVCGPWGPHIKYRSIGVGACLTVNTAFLLCESQFPCLYSRGSCLKVHGNVSEETSWDR